MQLHTIKTENITSIFGETELDLELKDHTLVAITFQKTDVYKLVLRFELVDIFEIVFSLENLDTVIMALELFAPFINCKGIERQYDKGCVKMVLPNGEFMKTVPNI